MDKQLKCVRCDGYLEAHAVYNALIELEKTNTGFEPVRNKSLPVIPYICGSCGYVELHLPS